MRAIEAREANPGPLPTVLAGGPDVGRLAPTRAAVRGGRLNLRMLASTGLRSVVLIGITLLMILIVLPAALLAAGT